VSQPTFDTLLSQLPAPVQEELALRWLARAVQVHLSALLEVAGDDASAARLRLIGRVGHRAQLFEVRDGLLEVLEAAVESWHRAIDDAKRGRAQWEQVLDALGPEQVTPWSVYLSFSEEIGELVEIEAPHDLAAGAARCARAAARITATLRVGGSPLASEAVGEAVEAEEEELQRREALARLPM
jgi:hypothetical protein